MSPRGPHCQILLLFLFLMAACLFSRSEGNSYQNFVQRHLDNPKSSYSSDNTYCYEMMRKRNLKCQKRNVFIHSSEDQLKSICTSRGRLLDGNQTSKNPFPITRCSLRRGLGRLTCSYSGKSKIKKIQVTCKNGLPVHYIKSK